MISDLPMHQNGNLGLTPEDSTHAEHATCQDDPAVGTHGQTGLETPEGCVSNTDNSEVSTLPKQRYAHFQKRRRRYTEELFRCQFVDMISRTPLVCNHLLWRDKPQDLRNHLLEHLKVEEVQKLSDDQVRERYSDAKRIFLAGIPEDIDDEDEDSTEGDPEDA